jgi:hypothetical protein
MTFGAGFVRDRGGLLSIAFQCSAIGLLLAA